MLSGDSNVNGQKNQQVLLAKNNFAVVLHNYNVKLPETSQLYVLWRKFCILSTFFAALPFRLSSCQRFSISHRRYKKNSFFSPNGIGLLFFISRSSSFSVIHVNRFCCCCLFVFISKSPFNYEILIYHRNALVVKMKNFTPSYMKGQSIV